VQEWRGEPAPARPTPAAVESSSGTLAMECQTEAPPSSRPKPSRPMSAKGSYFERLMQSKAAAARGSGGGGGAGGGGDEMSADDAAALQAARKRAAEAEARAAAAEAELEAEGEVDVVEAFPEFFPQYQQ